MNSNMWAHPATQANVETLRLRGAAIVSPRTGRLASRGEWGEGRLAEPADILGAVERAVAGAQEPPAEGLEGLDSRPLAGLRVLVTAGGTREPIDSVRFVGNRSSGRMGLALAAEALRRGAEVTLVAANVALEPPAGVRTIAVETAGELEAATRAEFATADVLLMAAAVADFRPAHAASDKLKKAGRESLELSLEPTVDVLAAVAEVRRADQSVIGFAAEHGEGGLEQARAKLERKGLDAVVLNDISRQDIGFDSDRNEVTVVTAGGERAVAAAPKDVVAAAILDEVQTLRAQRRPAGR